MAILSGGRRQAPPAGQKIGPGGCGSAIEQDCTATIQRANLGDANPPGRNKLTVSGSNVSRNKRPLFTILVPAGSAVAEPPDLANPVGRLIQWPPRSQLPVPRADRRTRRKEPQRSEFGLNGLVSFQDIIDGETDIGSQQPMNLMPDDRVIKPPFLSFIRPEIMTVGFHNEVDNDIGQRSMTTAVARPLSVQWGSPTAALRQALRTPLPWRPIARGS